MMAAHPESLCLENPWGRGAWRAAGPGVTESDMTGPLATLINKGAQTVLLVHRFYSSNPCENSVGYGNKYT